MATALFLASTPLHTFFALGLMHGPYRGRPQALWLVDQPEGARDYLAEAIQASGAAPELRRFPALKSAGQPARRLLREISEHTAALRPSTIAVGNDHRLEFYAALRGWPAARRTYIDDGLYSYLPREDARPAWREALSNCRRGLKYGLALERPSMVGGSRAVQDAYVLLPERVHAGLAGKPVRALRREWFAGPEVQATCLRAAALAGFDATRAEAIRLLLLLPHPRFLRADPALAGRLRELAAAHAARGETVALKSHPDADRLALDEQLGALPGGVLELPARLPVEVLAPLLSGTLVAGSLTTALLSLLLLGRGLHVRSLEPATPPGSADTPRRRFLAQAAEVYRAAGIRALEAADTAA
jgi:hypothetical protein